MDRQRVWIHINETSHSGAFIWSVYEVIGEPNPGTEKLYTKAADDTYIFVPTLMHTWNVEIFKQEYTSDMFTEYVFV